MHHVGTPFGVPCLVFRITVLPNCNFVNPVLFLFGGVGAPRTASTFGNSGCLRFKLIDSICHKNQQAFCSFSRVSLSE
jgi:hypothetical protein